MKTEDLKVDRDDLNFKVEDFESGKSNVLLVTGFAGSGKTTLASELAEKYDALHFQLDWFTDFMFGETTMEELEEQDEIGLIEYIKTNNLEGGQDYDSFEESEIVTMIRDYIKFLINWCKKQDDKFIIEGLSLYDIFQKGDDFITSCPMIIKGTSAETAIRRAAKRNAELDPETEEDDWYQELIKFAEADDKKLQALERELGLAEDFAAYDQMWEWVDAKGNKISTTSSQTSNTGSRPVVVDLKDKFDKLVTHLRSMYTLNINRQTFQLLDINIKVGTKFKNRLIVFYDFQKACIVGKLFDEFGKEVSSNNCWGGWSVLIAWLKKEGFPLINHLCENKLNESCKFDFTKEDLDAALDKLTDEDEPGLELGDNSEDTDVLTVAGEPYGGTKWYVDKWADNLYIITSELWGQDGGGPEEGVEEEFDSIEEVWDYLSQREQLTNIPNLKNLLAEWVDQQGKKVTTANGATLYTTSDESCDGCGCVVDGVYSDFFEPYKLQNGHKLCETCLEGWIKLPKGFVDKVILISNYNNIDSEIDGFIEKLKLDQQDIDNMINEWNKRKTAGTLGLSQHDINTIEDYFIDSAKLLHLTANKADFM